jgi:hypothetical protein
MSVFNSPPSAPFLINLIEIYSNEQKEYAIHSEPYIVYTRVINDLSMILNEIYKDVGGYDVEAVICDK